MNHSNKMQGYKAPATLKTLFRCEYGCILQKASWKKKKTRFKLLHIYVVSLTVSIFF